MREANADFVAAPSTVGLAAERDARDFLPMNYFADQDEDDDDGTDEPPIDEEDYRHETMTDEEYDDWLEFHGQPPIFRLPKQPPESTPT